MRDYEPLWYAIRTAYINSKNSGLPYNGTIAYDVPPQLVQRVIKAVSNEKGWIAGDSWPESRYTKLRTSYDSKTYELTFKLLPHRQSELRSLRLRKLL